MFLEREKQMKGDGANCIIRIERASLMEWQNEF